MTVSKVKQTQRVQTDVGRTPLSLSPSTTVVTMTVKNVVRLHPGCVIRERPDGFTVTMVRCRRVTVRCRRFSFEVESPEGQLQRFGFTETRQTVDAVVDGLIDGWRPPSGLKPPREWPPRRWVLSQIRHGLGEPVTAQCERLLQVVDPTVRAVHRALSAVTSKGSTLATCPELYRHRHLVSDITNYRAAAIVVSNFHSLIHRIQQMRITESSQLADLQALAAAHGAAVTVHVNPLGDQPNSVHGSAVSAKHALAHLQEWRSLLSPSGQSYRSLDRTLMNLPRRVPGHLVCLLNQITLTRPLTDGLELLLVTLFLERDRHRATARQNVFMAARAPQIREALRRVAAHTRNDLRVTRQRDIRFLIGFLIDFPGPHDGTIVGLTDKAIRWHRCRLTSERANVLERYGAQTRVSVPPIPLPADSSVRHLATVKEIVEEGERMGHCVASHVPYALRGAFFVFHVEQDGESATVMVREDGQVIDAQGPRNRSNRASRWGEGRLGRWARGFRGVEQQQAG